MISFVALVIPTDVCNLNGRTYPREVVEKALRNAGPLVIGTIGYDKTLESTAFCAMDFRMEQNGAVATIKLADTPEGHRLLDMINDPTDASVVFRPYGEAEIDEKGVITDYKLISLAAIDSQSDSFHHESIRNQ